MTTAGLGHEEQLPPRRLKVCYGSRPCKNSTDCSPEAILDPLYCGFGNDNLPNEPASMLDISLSGTAFSFHTASVGRQP